MNAEKLKTHDPQGYAEAVALGVAQERERVTKALTLAERPEIAARSGLVLRIADGIRKGEGYVDMLTSVTGMLQADLESPGPIGTGTVDTPTGEKPGGAASDWRPCADIEEM